MLEKGIKWFGEQVETLPAIFKDAVAIEALPSTTGLDQMLVVNDTGLMHQRALSSFTSLPNLLEIGDATRPLSILSSDIEMYHAVNDSDPFFAIGSAAAESVRINAVYDTGAQTLDYAAFSTRTADTGANAGAFRFFPDQSEVLSIDDGGINFIAGKGISIDGTDILTDSSGTATLSNIDALDSTTISTLNAALTAGDITSVTAGTGLSGGGTSGAVTLNVDTAQTQITSLGTLTALTVDNIGINGDTITASGDLAIVATGNDITVDTDTFTIESSTASQPIIKLINTTDNNEGSQIIFEKLRDDDGVANGQNIGEIWFRGQDTNQNTEDYAYIIGEIDVGTNDQESGQLKLGLANHDGGNGNGLILTGGSENDEIDVTVGLGSASVVTIPGNIDLAGDIDVDGTLETDALTVGGVAFTPSTTKNMTHHTIKDDIGTGVVYISLGEIDAESGAKSNKNLPLLAPVAGKLLKVFLRTAEDMSGSGHDTNLTWRLLTRTTSETTDGNSAVIGTQTGAGPTASSMVTYDFTSSLDSGTNAIAAGDKVQLSVQSDATSEDMLFFITCLWEWDLS